MESTLKKVASNITIPKDDDYLINRKLNEKAKSFKKISEQRENTLEKLEIAISHQKNSSPGHDKISLQTINHLPIKAINLLLKSFNDSWSSSQIPKGWSHAIILLFIKPHKNPKEVSSYRSISLTTVIAKLLEGMIVHRMLDLSFQNKTFHVNHHGFYPHRSSFNTLLQLQHGIILPRERKEYFILVALDIKAAYDSVWPSGLVSNLNKVGYSAKIASTCEFAEQENGLIRDRIVLKIKDRGLQELLLRENSQRNMKYDTATINFVKENQNKSKTQYNYKKCGRKHKTRECPAFGKICAKCKKKNHFAAKCFQSTKNIHEMNVPEN
ncbi:retrovirus-related Pol polyprotein from transposon 297 [Trichonephila clavipes]|nr:retrovirus-related Pol polyprotein from transposon 297 [Trichonephila clavipes]